MVMLDEGVIAGEEFRRDRSAIMPATSNMDWDDVRVFLAVARHGSLRAAGRALGLSQPTIGRRLATFEATFGGPTLFDRRPEGLRLNAAGEHLIPAAESVERAALMLERRPRRGLAGAVRYGAGVGRGMGRGVSVEQSWRRIGDASAVGHHRGIGAESEHRESGAPRGRSRGAAPPAASGRPLHRQARRVRGGGVPAPGCRSRRLGHLHRGAGALPRARRWTQRRLRDTGGRIALRASNMPMQLAAVRAGAGCGILPCFAGDADPLLERVTDPVPEIAAEYWVNIVHRDLRRALCVRAVIDWVKALFDEHRRRAGGGRLEKIGHGRAYPAPRLCSCPGPRLRRPPHRVRDRA